MRGAGKMGRRPDPSPTGEPEGEGPGPASPPGEAECTDWNRKPQLANGLSLLPALFSDLVMPSSDAPPRAAGRVHYQPRQQSHGPQP